MAENPLDLGDLRYGYDRLSKHTEPKSGTLYPLLMRLSDSGLLECHWKKPEKPGRPPRHAYRLTGTGMAFAHETPDLIPPNGGVLSVLKGIIPAGVSVLLHSHVDVEAFYIIAGELQLFSETANDWVVVKSGQFVYIPGEEKHAWRNASAEDATALLISLSRQPSQIFRGKRSTVRAFCETAGISGGADSANVSSIQTGPKEY